MSDGLEGVIAAETVLSHVDGAAGRLIVRGADIEKLAGRVSYEAMARRLWDGLAPAVPDEAGLRAALGEARVTAWRRLPALLAAAEGLPVIDGLRAGLALLPDGDDTHVRASAATAVFAAALSRHRRGLAPIEPDPALGQAADYLRLLRGAEADAAAVAAMDTYLVTVADHGLNASTFTARVVASTRAGMVASLTAALCALQGPLHGGAPGPVLDMLDDIGSEARIEAWIDQAMDGKQRLMGFGHRVYRTRDPRADVLKDVVRRLTPASAGRIAFAGKVEQAALAALAKRHPDRRLDTNVEFYTALALEALQIPRDLFTPTFAVGRVLGWAGHVFEQEQGGRLIRPASAYVGPLPEAA
jgi:citrate synthase